MAIYNVSTAAQLTSAIAKAVGGDRILIAPGDYDIVKISGRKFASEVVIQGASPTAMPHFDSLFVQDAANITFRSLNLGRALVATEPEYTQLNYIRNSSNIKLSGVEIQGSLDGDPWNDGIGLTVTNVTGLNVSNSNFKELYRGIQVVQSNQSTLQKNIFHTMRSDGVIVTAADGIVIDGNSFVDFRSKSGDHADAIQFWNTGQSKGSQNITIKNNVQMQNYWSGVEDTGVQGIFIADPLEYGYKNILIQNNLLYSSNVHNGINVTGGTGVQIIGNTVLSKSNDAKQFWIRLDASEQVVLKDNFTDNFVMRNVSKLFQSSNTNLSLTPGARAVLPNLNEPTSVLDLIAPNKGYQSPTAVVAAPVSTAVGSSLSNMLNPTGSASVQKTAIAAVSDALDFSLPASSTIDLSNLSSALVSATPVRETAVISAPPLPVAADFAPALAAFAPTMHVYEHFTALA